MLDRPTAYCNLRRIRYGLEDEREYEMLALGEGRRLSVERTAPPIMQQHAGTRRRRRWQTMVEEWDVHVFSEKGAAKKLIVDAD